MMIRITYAVKTTGILNRHTVQLPQPWETRLWNLNASKSEAKCSPTLQSHDEVCLGNEWFGEGQNSYLSQARLLKISVQYCKSSAEPLKRLHSSKCQQQTLNIQRRAQHSGVLSCFPSECKNNVKQQPALLLSNLWQVIEIPDLALQCPATFKLTS